MGPLIPLATWATRWTEAQARSASASAAGPLGAYLASSLLNCLLVAAVGLAKGTPPTGEEPLPRLPACCTTALWMPSPVPMTLMGELVDLSAFHSPST